MLISQSLFQNQIRQQILIVNQISPNPNPSIFSKNINQLKWFQLNKSNKLVPFQNNINKMHKFCEHSFSLKISDLKLNRKKFPGQIFASWNLNFNHKEGDTLVGPAIDYQNGLLSFQNEVEISTKLVYNKQQQVYHPKKSILHFLHTDNYEESSKNNKFTNVGVISIDLAAFATLERESDGKVYTLEKCFDKSATAMLVMKPLKEKDLENLDKSFTASVDSRGSRVRKDPQTRQKSKEKIEELTDEILKTAIKASKKNNESLIKTADKPVRSMTHEINDGENMDNPLSKYVSQFRSQNQINLDKEIQLEKQNNLMLSTKITELEDIIRQSMSDATNQTINQLEEALSHSKTNVDYLKKQLKEANDEISKLTNKVQVLDLENKQLKSEVETARKLTKKVRFNLEEETTLEDVREELKKQKMLNVEMQAKLFLQTEDCESLKSQNQSLMQQIQLLAQQIQNQKKSSDFYRVQFEEFKLKSDRKRKEKSKKYRQKMFFLSNQVMRLHAELYNLRTSGNQKSVQQSKLIQQNDELRRFCSQKKKYESMKDIILKMSKNKTADDELLRTVRSKSKDMKKKYDSIHSVDAKGKNLMASVAQIKALNTKLGGINDKKLASCLREMENKIEDLMEVPILKP